jgi:GNAT superfamily N-acetyltransferase
MSELEVQAVTPDRWDDLVDLFERRGPRGGTPTTDWCWCMWWRDRSHDRSKNRPAMAGLVSEGREPGLLAYEEGRPVGWVSVARRREYGQLLRSPTLKPDNPNEDGVYAIACFYVHPSAKRRGVAQALLAAAVEHARKRGAKAVEAYPSKSTDSGAFMGSESSFTRYGFEPVRKAGRRTVMRYEL